jgi:hypothetical protein
LSPLDLCYRRHHGPKKVMKPNSMSVRQADEITPQRLHHASADGKRLG